ncbi:MAG: DUF1772 domain-containing protein [Sphaerospermopsis sp. SIO1G2]|nr:DUF1772 domain-containing protein [Sphaerospermopsis sp. SIO1G1]NET70782.1 DUF1772 domain-containing protein [Sphaerospermopsis sp. SIO1G2]
MTILQNFRLPLIVFSAITTALSAGIFFGFSTFIMQALARQPIPQGIATMQTINITVINPWFMTAFFGPALTCLILTIASCLNWNQSSSLYLILGSLLYLIGTIGVTIFGNVPLNDALAIVSPDSLEGANLWKKYLTDWTFWNHVRTIAGFLAAILLTVSLYNYTKLPN